MQYDCSLTPTMNIGLTASLLSRFDLLFIVLDQMDSDIDSHLLNMYCICIVFIMRLMEVC